MKKYYASLRACPLFSDITDDNLLALLSCLGATVRKYAKRETILAEGTPARTIGIVLSGAAQLSQVDYFGNRSIVADVGPTELFGESFACAGVKAIPVDIVATEATEVMQIECSRITHPCSHACGFHGQLIYNLMRVVATKNLQFHQKIEITSKRTTREKLMTYLLAQAKKSRSDTFEIPYDRQELADFLAVDRSGLSAEIGKLRREGVIRAERNRFTILDPEMRGGLS